MVIRAYGRDGLAELISGHMELARRWAELVESTPGWELLAPVPFSTICFRAHPQGLDDESELDRLNERLVERVNQSGVAFVSHTQVGGRFAIRIAIGNAATTWDHLERVWTELRRA